MLRGDPSDGLPGVRGIGQKLAADLITRYGSIEGVIAAAESDTQGVAIAKVRRELDYVRRAVEVVTIPTDLPIPKVDLKRPRRVADERVYDLADRHGLGNAVRRLAAAIES